MGFRTKLESDWRKSPARTALAGFVILLGISSGLVGIVSGTAGGIVTGIMLFVGTGALFVMLFGRG